MNSYFSNDDDSIKDVDWDRVAKEKDLPNTVSYKGLVTLKIDDVESNLLETFNQKLEIFKPISFKKTSHLDSTWIVSLHAISKRDAMLYVFKALAETLESCESIKELIYLNVGLHLSPTKIDFSELEDPFNNLAYQPANPVVLEIYKDLQGAMHCNFLEWSSN